MRNINLAKDPTKPSIIFELGDFVKPFITFMRSNFPIEYDDIKALVGAVWDEASDVLLQNESLWKNSPNFFLERVVEDLMSLSDQAGPTVLMENETSQLWQLCEEGAVEEEVCHAYGERHVFFKEDLVKRRILFHRHTGVDVHHYIFLDLIGFDAWVKRL